MPSAFEAKSLRDVLDLARYLDLFETSRPHPGLDVNLAKQVREALIGDLNKAMSAFLAEINPPPAPPAPAPAPEPAPAAPAPSGDSPDASPDVKTDPPPPDAPAATPEG